MKNKLQEIIKAQQSAKKSKDLQVSGDKEQRIRMTENPDNITWSRIY